MSISRETMGLGILAVAVNIALAMIKIGVGFVGNSYALIADGIESAGDIVSSLITWAGFQLSLKPPDEGHPYGHGKIESLAGMFSGVSLWVSAAIIGWQSIKEIRTPHGSPEWFTLPVLLGVVAIKWFLARKIRNAADSLESNALRGDAGHHLSDALTMRRHGDRHFHRARRRSRL
ncbi:MAG: cation diffusion facilitator family transporter [Pirellulales bacterium]